MNRYNRNLFVFAIVSILLWFVLLTVTQQQFHKIELSNLQTQSIQRLRVYEDSLRNSIRKFSYLPKVLASDPRIHNALDTAQSNREISEFLQQTREQSGAEEIFLMQTSGLSVASSNFDSEDSFIGQNYSFRPYFKQAVTGQSATYYAIGATSGNAGFFLAEPVYRSGQIIGVIVVKISLTETQNIWLQSGEKVWLTDKFGIVFLSSNEAWLYRSLNPLSESALEELAQTRQYADYDIRPFYVQPGDMDVDLVDLNGEGPHILFSVNVEDQQWTINWLYSLDAIQKKINQNILYLSTIYIVFILALMWLRERFRNHQNEQKLTQITRTNEARQRALIDSTDAGLIIINANGDITFINAQARQLFRLTNEDQPDIQSLIAPWHGVKATVTAQDATGLRQDRSQFPILVTTSAIGFSNEEEFLITVHDVTELKSAQLELIKNNNELEQRIQLRTEALKTAERELSQSQRLAALGRMSSAIAHELNQPITAIESYTAASEVLLSRQEYAKVDGNLHKIKSLIERLSYISRQLRMVSGKRNTGLSSTRILPVAFYAQDVLHKKLTDNEVSLTINISRQDEALANTMMLEQVVVNLISNAIDAVAEQPIRSITVSGTQSDDVYQLSIHDTGAGLTNEEKLHIFEPFYTTKEVTEGLGLGLAISYNLVSDMDGKLTVSSDADQGTTFTILLLTSEAER